jgi:hypothetical protein
MTRESFIKVLEEKRYPYSIEGNKIVVTSEGNVYLGDLTSIPPDVVFRNGGAVDLSSLTSLSPGVEFRNGKYVYLESLTSLPPGVEFRNGGYVHLKSLIGGWFWEWEGNIEGVNSKTLLNKMIQDGLFEKRI